MRRRRVATRTAVAVVGLLVVLNLVWWWQPLPVYGLLEWAAPSILWRVATSRPAVALTFDDGPDPTYTPQVLAILRRHDAHATFFLIGERAAGQPGLVAAIRAGGHEVGNHYLRRGITLGVGRQEFEENLEYAEALLGSPKPNLYRPPGGVAWPWQLRLARARGYSCVLGSAYPHDPAHPPAGYIAWLIEKNLAPGTIVILHDGVSDPSRSIQALPRVLEAGRRKGLSFVTVGELLRRR